MHRETTIDVIEPQPAYAHPAPTNQSTAPKAWTMVIRPQRNLFDLRLGELWQARDLVMLFVWRDFVAGQKQTTLTFTIIFYMAGTLLLQSICCFL